MEIICLDINVLIAHKWAKKAEKDKTFLYQLTLKPYQFVVSSITVYELLRGDNQDEDAFWKAMLSNMTVLDLLIAATALANKMRLATGNIKHFDRVENLELVVENRS